MPLKHSKEGKIMAPEIIFALVLASATVLVVATSRIFFKNSVTFTIIVTNAINSVLIAYLGFFIGHNGVIHVLWALPVVIIELGTINTIVNKKVTIPLKKVVKILENISSGDGDLTIKLDEKSKTEIGQIAVNFNKFEDKMVGIIKSLKDVGSKSSEIGNNLAANSEEVSATLEEISTTMNSMHDRIQSLSDELQKSNNSIKDISDFTSKVVRLIESQSTSVSESSAAIEEMIASLMNIEKNTEEKKLFTDGLVNIAKDSEKSMATTVTSIIEISKSTETILDMIGIINNVAEQTNLLAMNAAIEAAHAGEYGKGFSVVADEIRKLSETTSSNSKNISSTLKVIINSINETSSTTQNTNVTINKLITGIKDVSESMNESLTGIREISIGNKQITESLTKLIEITEDVNSSSKEINNRTESIESSIKNISELADENSTGISETTVGINEISNAVIMLSDLSSKNSDNLNLLEKEILRFKVEK
jgi:methyl-accepting chemotaxis protein